VDRNIIWGSKHSKSIFGENGLSGIINVDISPEFATRLGAAYGSIFKKGSKVVVSSTTANSARMFKHAFISGILSVGVEVFNLSSLLTLWPAMQSISFPLREEFTSSSVRTIQTSSRLILWTPKGKHQQGYRKENRKLFCREDFKRCSGDEVSRLNNITDFKNYYVRSILNEVNVEAIKNNPPKLCIVSPSDFVISIVVPMLTDLGCKVASFSSTNVSEVDTIVDEIKDNNASFAAFIDSNGETLVLIDKNGNVVKDDLFLCLTSLITFKSVPNSKVVVPITAPSIIETLAERYNGKVVRTKTSPQAVMEQMLNHNLFKNRENMYQFLLNFDAIAGLVKIIEFLCLQNTTLTETIKEIPDFYVSKKKIFCPWELKGRVMRTLITEKDQEKVELLDGVKFILENGWALVLPTRICPLQGLLRRVTPEVAETISDKYIDKIKAIINDKK